MSTPLVLSGPGGAYRTEIVEQGDRLVRRAVRPPIEEAVDAEPEDKHEAGHHEQTMHLAEHSFHDAESDQASPQRFETVKMHPLANLKNTG